MKYNETTPAEQGIAAARKQAMQKQYEIWVSWNTGEPAYTCDDFMEAMNVFKGVMLTCPLDACIEVRCNGTVIAAYPIEEG